MAPQRLAICANHKLSGFDSKDHRNVLALISKKDVAKSSNPSSSVASSSQSPAHKLSLSPTSVFKIGLIAGALAGIVVDLILFPLDTVKTRLQAKGAKLSLDLFNGIYAGFAPAVVASAPAAAAFFGTYDYVKRTAGPALDKIRPDGSLATLSHMLAAACGDITSSAVRMPFELIKQKMQAGKYASLSQAVQAVYQQGGLGGFYNGYFSLVIRELPFDLIQFPLYEALKSAMLHAKKHRVTIKANIPGTVAADPKSKSAASSAVLPTKASPGSKSAVQTSPAKQVPVQLAMWENSLCGSIAGGVSGGLTTPFDVIKTRLMTAPSDYKNITFALNKIVMEEGPKALFKGFVPRVMWISVGGAIFFGGYEYARRQLEPIFHKMEATAREKRKAKQTMLEPPATPPKKK